MRFTLSRFPCPILLITAFLLLSEVCRAQIIYSLNGTVIRTDEHDWKLDLGFGWFGFVQFKDRVWEHRPWVTRTDVYFGRHLFTVPLPALAVAAIGIASISSLVWLAIAVSRWVQRPRQAEPSDTSTPR